MLRFCLSFLLLFFPYFLFFGDKYSVDVPDRKDVMLTTEAAACAQLYHTIQLGSIVGWDAFRQAVAGYHKIADRRRGVLTLINFSRPSIEKRLFVFGTKQHRLLFSSVASYGENSSEVHAASFSNEYGFYKSSLGFYLTETAYQGKNGYSLIPSRLEGGIDDRARERAIVIHRTAYVGPSIVGKDRRLGRGFGCPAIPQKLTRPIIDTIRGGSVTYIYTEIPDYLAHSSAFSGYRA